MGKIDVIVVRKRKSCEPEKPKLGLLEKLRKILGGVNNVQSKID